MATGVIVSTEAYASLADVLELLPSREYDANSQPTVSQVENIIKKVAKEINARLRALGYSPPLTNADDIILLSQINALGAAVITEAATLGTVQADSPVIQTYQQQYQDMLKALSNGAYTFAGAGDSPTQDADGPDDLDEQGDRADPIFVNSKSQRESQF